MISVIVFYTRSSTTGSDNQSQTALNDMTHVAYQSAGTSYKNSTIFSRLCMCKSLIRKGRRKIYLNVIDNATNVFHGPNIVKRVLFMS